MDITSYQTGNRMIMRQKWRPEQKGSQRRLFMGSEASADLRNLGDMQYERQGCLTRPNWIDFKKTVHRVQI